MALDTPARSNGQQRGSTGLTGRGRPVTVTMRRTTALAGILEGLALADETIASADRLHNAAMAGSRLQVINEAGRLSTRATASRTELRRLAGEMDR